MLHSAAYNLSYFFFIRRHTTYSHHPFVSPACINKGLFLRKTTCYFLLFSYCAYTMGNLHARKRRAPTSANRGRREQPAAMLWSRKFPKPNATTSECLIVHQNFWRPLEVSKKARVLSVLTSAAGTTSRRESRSKNTTKISLAQENFLLYNRNICRRTEISVGTTG